MFSLIPWKKQRNDSSALANRTEHPLNFFRNSFDSILDTFFGRWPLYGDPWSAWNDMGVEDRENEFVVRADAPGFEADDFDIQVSGNVLKISAEHAVNSTNGEREAQRYFERSMTLPAGIDAQHVEASYRNGVLEVRLPKDEESKPRKIAVKTT